jgi:glyoxylase-like metal-dependent hydrolase (beta-lactamase superfamily II)
MRRLLLLVAVAIAVAVGGLLLSAYATVRATALIREDVRLDGVQVVRDRFVAAYLVDLAPGEVALVDTGDDAGAKGIQLALSRRGLGPEAVKFILLTHGDYDHVGGAAAFPAALPMILAPDAALAEGRGRRGPFGLVRTRASALRIGRELHDGESLSLGGVAVRVFAVPGHSAGSAAYLARGVLFLGDSCELRKDGRLDHGWWFTNDDTSREEVSLAGLAARLAPEAGAIRAIACGHSAVDLRGLAPLAAMAGR